MIARCADCGRPEDATQNVALLVQSITINGKAHHFATCQRCALKRGAQDQHEMREQLERSMKTKAKVA